MTIATFADLKASLASWSNRSDLTAQIPDFIGYGHQQICSMLRAPVLLQTTTVTVGAETVATPAGFLAAARFYLNLTPRITLKQVTAEARSELAAQYATGDHPGWFALEGSNFVFAPPFTGSATGSLLYYAQPSTLAADTDTNVVLSKYPFLYLFGGLSALFSYLEDDARADRWEGKFLGLIAEINKAERNDATRAPLQSVPFQGGIV